MVKIQIKYKDNESSEKFFSFYCKLAVLRGFQKVRDVRI